MNRRHDQQIQAESIDEFEIERRRGLVVGSVSGRATTRGGVDSERLMSIRDGALRIGNPLRPGWGRHVVSYGPIEAAVGTWMSATVLNGHNSSQGGLLSESIPTRVKRWMKGAEAESWPRHVLSWAKRGDKKETSWLFRKWFAMRSAARKPGYRQLNENLSVGWMPTAKGGDPAVQGGSFVMRAAEHDNGELCIGGGGCVRPLVRRVTNIPISYISVVRHDGLAFYAGASTRDVPTLPATPEVRLLAILPFKPADRLFATVQQAALGQVGFVSATRVYGVKTGQSGNRPFFETGGCICSDRLTGDGVIDGTNAGEGQTWAAISGSPQRSPEGLTSSDDALAGVKLREPVGFLRLKVSPGGSSSAELRWRVTEAGDGWAIKLTATTAAVGRYQSGEWCETARAGLAMSPQIDLQIIDDGKRMRAFGDSRDLFGEWESTEGCTATGVTIGLSGSGPVVRDFEAFPRAIRLPEEMVVPAPASPHADVLRLDESLRGDGRELDRLPVTGVGATGWWKTFGHGAILATERGAQVDASPAHPLRDRTGYTVAWEHAGTVALEIDVAPPGDRRGMGANGRAGVVFWQDADNYFIVSTWLDDGYAGASISSFFRIRGHEELYNAVWVNVGDRVSWGRPYTLRVTFDGNRFVAEVDGEPVLYRALTDVNPDWPSLEVRRVGIVANWEWGTDAGSLFSRFRAWSEQ